MKTSTPNARTIRRVWSILLCLVMALGLLPATALAAVVDAGNGVVEWRPDGETTLAGRGASFVLEVVVEQGGTKAPPAETFEFELVDTAEDPQDPSYYGVGLTVGSDLEIQTNGAGTFQKTIHVTLPASGF